jgi:hypothetical protein
MLAKLNFNTKFIFKILFLFFASLKLLKQCRIQIVSQRYGSADKDPDPHQNVTDPRHCEIQIETKKNYSLASLSFSYQEMPPCLLVCRDLEEGAEEPPGSHGGPPRPRDGVVLRVAPRHVLNLVLADQKIFFLSTFFSKLLHLLSLRFHCVAGCWDPTQDSCDDYGIGSLML